MNPQRGFTLIEMAIVLVIMTILIGGLAVPLSAQIQARRVAETNKTLEEAREAIIGYAMSHTVSSSCTCQYKVDTSLDPGAANCPGSLCPATGTASSTLTLTITRHYLPCPDLNGTDPEPGLDNDGVDSLRDINNGVEDRQPGSSGSPYVAGSSCAAPSGNLPWVTLGTAAQDAWGNRLQYAVTDTFTNSTTGFSSTTTGNLQVCSASGCATVDVAKDVPVVLLSYGPNGWGARNINGTTLRLPTSDDEKENTNGDDKFVSHSPIKPDATNKEFDDLVVWISDGLLKSRVCQNGCP